MASEQSLVESITDDQRARFDAALVHNSATGCMEWSKHRNGKGYGRVGVGLKRLGNRRCVLSHRVAYELANGPMPAGACVLHRCDNPPCCNPDHLFIGTRADNNADMRAKGRASGGSMPGWMHPGAKFAPSDVEEIHRLRAQGWTLARIGQRFNVYKSTVGRVLSGKTYANRAQALYERTAIEEPGQLSLLEGVA